MSYKFGDRVFVILSNVDEFGDRVFVDHGEDVTDVMDGDELIAEGFVIRHDLQTVSVRLPSCEKEFPVSSVFKTPQGASEVLKAKAKDRYEQRIAYLDAVCASDLAEKNRAASCHNDSWHVARTASMS